MHRPFNEQETAVAESNRRIGDISSVFLKIQAGLGAADFRRPGGAGRGNAGHDKKRIGRQRGDQGEGARNVYICGIVRNPRAPPGNPPRDRIFRKKRCLSADARVCGDHADRPCTCVLPSVKRQSRPRMDDMQSTDYTPCRRPHGMGSDRNHGSMGSDADPGARTPSPLGPAVGWIGRFEADPSPVLSWRRGEDGSWPNMMRACWLTRWRIRRRR